ncbi:hypothetical protein [Nostoc sp. DedQUE02]|uniref:hypothetical protein n=1 Tax=Nostoc sp. DedQUE02 TaxID=3075388 RepID=UPI002AD27B1C|nr:hypothetical protein [Nostoc sp. DedQUE03]
MVIDDTNITRCLSVLAKPMLWYGFFQKLVVSEVEPCSVSLSIRLKQMAVYQQ